MKNLEWNINPMIGFKNGAILTELVQFLTVMENGILDLEHLDLCQKICRMYTHYAWNRNCCKQQN